MVGCEFWVMRYFENSVVIYSTFVTLNNCNCFFAIAIVLEQPSRVVIFDFRFPNAKAAVANPNEVPNSKIVLA